jgi:hypothetical protein
MKTSLCARLPVFLCLAVALLLASPFAFRMPAAAAASGWCASPKGVPTICETSYQPGSSTLILRGVAFTPNSRASITVTGPNISTAEHFTLQVSPKGHILALALELCYVTPSTLTAVDLKTGKQTLAHTLPVCEAAVTQLQSHTLAADLAALGQPETTTPGICASGFDGTEQTAGTLSIVGTGFRPKEHVHVYVAGSEVPAMIYADTADQNGMLFSDAPKKVTCTVNNVTVQVTDSSAKTDVHYTVSPFCLMIHTSSNSGGGWHLTIVPIGLIIAVGGTIIRRLRRGSIFGR